jgi:hypothetical protein
VFSFDADEADSVAVWRMNVDSIWLHRILAHERATWSRRLSPQFIQIEQIGCPQDSPV